MIENQGYELVFDPPGDGSEYLNEMLLDET